MPFEPFLRSMSSPFYPRHTLAPHVEDGTFADVWGIDADPAEVIGTGLFTLARYDREARVVLRRIPDYRPADDAGTRLPNLDEIVRVIVPDLARGLARFDSNGLHRSPQGAFLQESGCYLFKGCCAGSGRA